MSDQDLCILMIRAIVTLVAAFSGAWFAYRFQNKREKLKEERSQKAALNNAMFTLSRQYNALTYFKKDFDYLKNDESRAFKLKPWKTNKYEDLKFDIDSLNFLIETEDPNILFQLLVEQERFEQAMESIKVRSKYQIDVIQPLLEASDIANKKLPYEIVSNAIGKHKLEGLVLGTDEVYTHIYESHKTAENMLFELYAYAKKLFPKNKFINVDKNT